MPKIVKTEIVGGKIHTVYDDGTTTDTDLHAAPPFLTGAASGGGLSESNQRHVDSSTPLNDGGAVLVQPDDDLILVDANGDVDILISLPDSPIGKIFTVARIDGDTNSSVTVTTPQDSVWGFPQNPGTEGAATILPNASKSYVSNGVDGWWLLSVSYQSAPGFYGMDPNFIHWAGISDLKVLAYDGYGGGLIWTNAIAGLTNKVLWAPGPVTEDISPDVRYVNAFPRDGEVVLTLPPTNRFENQSEVAGSGSNNEVGMLITIVNSDNTSSGHVVTINVAGGNPFGWNGQGFSVDQTELVLTQYNESVTLLGWNNSWIVLEHFNPGPNVYTLTDNFAILAGDFVLCDGSIRTFGVTLPSDAQKGAEVTIKLIDATHSVTVSSHGGLIEGEASPVTLTTLYETLTLVSDGTDWWKK